MSLNFQVRRAASEGNVVPRPSSDSLLRRFLAFLLEYNLVLIFLAIFIALSLSVQYFFTVQNMLGLALSVSQIGMVACTMMFCLASREFDLSVGSVVAFTGVLSATGVNATDNLWCGVAAALLSGAIIGCVNGMVIAYLRINALITTLATMEIVRGLAFIASHGHAVGVSNADFILFAGSSFLGISMPIWTTLACFVLFGFFVNSALYGRNTLRICGNPA